MERKISAPYPKRNNLNIVVPIDKGGHGGTNIAEAAQNLGAVSKLNFDQPNGVAKGDASALVKTAQLPTSVQSGATLSGNPSITINQVCTFSITNYDSLTSYIVSATGGTISINADTITYTAPNVVGTYNIVVNGVNYPITVGPIRPAKPTITGVVSGSNGLANITLTGSTFTMLSGSSTQRSTDWEIYSDSALANLVTSSLDDMTNLTGFTATGLALSTTFYIRARYRSANNQPSDWSDVINLTSAASYYPTHEEAKLIASDKAASDQFGTSVALDSTGTRAIVGSPYNDAGGTNDAGAAYIFLRTGSTWAQEAKLVAADKASSDVFGQSVAIDSTGTRVVIGAYMSDPSSVVDGGAAYVFLRTGTSWAQETKLSANDKASSDSFGNSVSIDSTGTRIVVGSPYTDSSGITDSGGAYVFTRSGITWTQEAKLIATDLASSDRLGTSVYITDDGTRVIAGSPIETPSGVLNAGAAYIFVRSGTTWSQEAKLTASDKTNGDRFGTSVTIDSTGTRAAVGSYLSDPGGTTNAGAVYVFLRTGSTWVQEAKLVSSDKASGDFLGSSVCIDNLGSCIISGAYAADISGLSDCGAAYMFTRSGVTWNQSAKFSASDKVAQDDYGYAVGISRDSTRIIVGSNLADPGTINNAGAAYIYS